MSCEHVKTCITTRGLLFADEIHHVKHLQHSLYFWGSHRFSVEDVIV